jgi:transposase-like protein
MINYKTLRKINPEAARLAVIEYLSTNKGNISDAARTFGIQRTVVYDILKKEEEGDLRDRSRAPLHSPYKIPDKIEDKVVKTKNQTHLGAKRLSVYLKKYEKIEWSEPLRLDTLSLNTPYIPESYSLPITSRIPLEADSLKRNATSSYYTHLL